MLCPRGKVRIGVPRSDESQYLTIRDKLLKVSPHNTGPKELVCSLHQKHYKLHVFKLNFERSHLSSSKNNSIETHSIIHIFRKYAEMYYLKITDKML